MTPRIPILLYHRILRPEAGGAGTGLSVDADSFQRDMSRLHASGWVCVSAAEAAEHTLAGKKAGRVFAVTFDDGYRDFAEIAHPILRNLGFTATVFVVTDRIGGPADWSTVEGGSLLDADEIRSLVQEGVSFGSHGRTHSRLPGCSDGELLDQLSGSRTKLSEIVGREVTTMAWPYGENDERTRQAAGEAGYRLGYAVAGDGPLGRRAHAALRHTVRDRLAIPRREVRGGDSRLRRRLRMGPMDGLFVTARKIRSASGGGS